MPTVPCSHPSRVPADAVVVAPVHDDPLHHADPCELTPDPDLDELRLVSVEHGNTVTEVSDPPHAHKGLLSERPSARLPVPERRHLPQTDLPMLALHSRSSGLSTPIQLSPRFEYPFPAGVVFKPDIARVASLSSPSEAFSVLSASPFALPASAHTHPHRHPKFENAPHHTPIPPGLMNKRRSVGEQVPPVRPHSSSLSNVDIAARTHQGVPVQVRKVQEIKASLQRGWSDETAVGQESKAKAKAQLDAEVDAASGEAILLAQVKKPDVTVLGHTSRATSEASLTDVDPAEDKSAARLVSDDSNDYRPRSGAGSPAPADTPSSSTVVRTRRAHGCIEA